VSTSVLAALPPAGRFDVLAVGECSLDTRLVVERLPRAGEKVDVLGWDEQAGGQMATAALAATRLGLRVAYAGATGDDAAHESVLAPLRDAGVDLTRVVRVPGARTRSAVIAVEASSGERTILGYRDAALDAARGRLAALDVESSRLLLLDGSDPALALELAWRARACGRAVVLDLDAPVDGFETLCRAVDFPVVSRHFAEQAWGGVEPTLAALAALGARLAVVTLGAEGARARLGEQSLHSPAFAVPVVDTTGAGDTFHAAFAWGLLAGLGADALLRAANAAAALSCTGEGAQGARVDALAVAGLLEQSPARGRD